MYDKPNIPHIEREERGWDEDDTGIYIAEGYIRVPVGVVKDGGFTSYIGKREVVNHAACFESNFFQTVPSYSF